MATRISYLLVSGAENIGEVDDHPSVSESGFTRQDTREADSEHVPSVTFAVEHPLEEASDLEEPVRALSADFPEATVVLCEVEERFDHVERLQTVVFMEGKHAGDVEHGYIFNVGQEG